MSKVLRILWTSDEGQDIAEYAVMLAVILILVIGTLPFDRRKREQRVFQRRQQFAVEERPMPVNLR